MSALEVEHLDGGNQYACDHCGRKVNATRQLRLRTLPPYLCMSLKRFVFDMRVRDCSQMEVSVLHCQLRVPQRPQIDLAQHVPTATSATKGSRRRQVRLQCR